ncbi:prepilin-type N-terminal cleavage/methylation domain-containing protein [Cyanobium gracile UHCC 0139]|uniref:Prepilin-type N-terminal cleavage/methylation domain-containing protein n=1 Tax=Cyanobium gracile UHCC 0139 TaxID=3110308 RepID=A0ABU5RUI5_9CYAN|nr:prepilin-type N-terminal cleavage/methylation domain-containing protein [Cyanobium gracile]MEA5391429.1 prepilin-type N-terminal cleavage/methylation domain-containing protein [Cyanobium gracile UHCC 0139]
MKHLPSPFRGQRLTKAFTVVELMVTVAVIGILGSVAFASSQVFLRRDQANAAAAELMGWLEGISGRSGAFGPCVVQFTTASNVAPGTTFATLQNAGANPRCTPEANLALPSTDGNRTYNVAVTYTPNSATSLTFTPRGGVVANGVEAVVKISVNNQLPLRCVRISFGTLSTGINNTTGDVSQTCTVWERT